MTEYKRKKYAEETGSAAGTDRGDETDRLHADNRQETDEDKKGRFVVYSNLVFFVPG